MNKRILLLLSLSLVLLVGAACYPPATAVPPASGSGNSITDIEWQWTNVTNKTTATTTAVPNPQAYTVVFRDDGTLSGKADCNTFTGAWSQEMGFSISIGTSTMAACGDASLDVQYMQLLSAVAAGGPDGTGSLALETAGGEQRMLFVNGGSAPR